MSEKESLLRFIFREQRFIDVEHWAETSKALDSLVVFNDKVERGKTIYVYPDALEA